MIRMNNYLPTTRPMDKTTEGSTRNPRSHNTIEFQLEMLANCSCHPGTNDDSHNSKCKLAGTHEGTMIRIVSSECGLPHTPIPNNAAGPLLNRLVLFMVIYLRLPS